MVKLISLKFIIQYLKNICGFFLPSIQLKTLPNLHLCSYFSAQNHSPGRLIFTSILILFFFFPKFPLLPNLFSSYLQNRNKLIYCSNSKMFSSSNFTLIGKSRHSKFIIRLWDKRLLFSSCFNVCNLFYPTPKWEILYLKYIEAKSYIVTICILRTLRTQAYNM